MTPPPLPGLPPLPGPLRPGLPLEAPGLEGGAVQPTLAASHFCLQTFFLLMFPAPRHSLLQSRLQSARAAGVAKKIAANTQEIPIRDDPVAMSNPQKCSIELVLYPGSAAQNPPNAKWGKFDPRYKYICR
jgi:hypothetical protein